MNTSKIESLINKFGLDFIQRMKNEITANRSVATGTLEKSISYNYSIAGEQILMQFLSEDYGKYIDKGRAAGSYPPISKIKQWCSAKGLPQKAAYPISKKIYKFGIKPKPFLFNDFENRKHAFMIELIAAYGSLVEIEVVNALNTLPKQTIIS